jgi:uncharacterized protein YicC (UPF0701 family)
MTGYGRGITENFRVEIRSSNHKNLDINIHIPPYLFSHDLEIRKRVKQKFNRGRIEIFVPKQEVDTVRLKVKLSISDSIGIDIIASQRDVFLPDEAEIDIVGFFDAFGIALSELEKTRVKEGKDLINDINKRLRLLNKNVTHIEKIRKKYITNAHQKLYKRLKELIGNVAIDETRLIQETAILIEKSDITEEIVRIKSHLRHCKEVLMSGNTIGKKVDFIIQELRRESNTIGSKSQDVEITAYVVEIKHELEKIREQVQNLQ